ncbi:HAMP domain-containing protein [Micromonospora sp. ATA32]|nr:HAMP domain-containing protein [Micromonospora sp. ATA32]
MGRLPLRIRLIAGFAAAMLLVLAGAGAFVYLRVQYALDLRLDEDLAAQSAQLTGLVRAGGVPHDNRAVATAPGGYYQILDAGNHVLAASPGLPAGSLLTPHQLDVALRQPLRRDRGTLIPISTRPLRLYAVPLQPGATPPAGQPAVTVAAVRRDQRDEALRELIGQLTLANLAALAIASLVGYRLARAALAPVERYRSEAARIAGGATGVRLAVPDRSDDEVARLGRTLNDMLTALEAALDRERRFINDASHELRTPLTLLSTELELALRRPRSAAELEQTLRSAAADTAHLIALADTLLSVGVQPAHADSAPEVNLTELLARPRRAVPGHHRRGSARRGRGRPDRPGGHHRPRPGRHQPARQRRPVRHPTHHRHRRPRRRTGPAHGPRQRSRHEPAVPAARRRTIQPRRHRPHLTRHRPRPVPRGGHRPRPPRRTTDLLRRGTPPHGHPIRPALRPPDNRHHDHRAAAIDARRPSGRRLEERRWLASPPACPTAPPQPDPQLPTRPGRRGASWSAPGRSASPPTWSTRERGRSPGRSWQPSARRRWSSVWSPAPGLYAAAMAAAAVAALASGYLYDRWSGRVLLATTLTNRLTSSPHS